MVLLGMILSVLGLGLVLAAGIVLLLYIFVPEEELTRFAALSLEESTSHTTGAQSHRTLPIVVTDLAQVRAYRDQFIAARRDERRRGRWGFCLLIAGSFLQIIGVVVSFYATKT